MIARLSLGYTNYLLEAVFLHLGFCFTNGLTPTLENEF